MEIMTRIAGDSEGDEAIPERFEEEEIEEEESYLSEALTASEFERRNWYFSPGEKIFDLKNLKFKPFTTAVGYEERYRDACAITSTLYTRQFIKNLAKRKLSIKYYDKPYGEYHVQGKFFKNIDVIEMVDTEANYDLVYHITEEGEVLPHVQELKLVSCGVGPDLLRVLCPRLGDAYLLRSLDLSHNPIGDQGLEVILRHLHFWAGLEDLRLFDTQITPSGFERLASLYSKQRIFVKRLDLGRNKIGDEGAVRKLLAGIARKSPPIEELALAGCSLSGAEAARHLEEQLSGAVRLQSLDLSLNLFSCGGAALALGGLLLASPALARVVLDFNPFTDGALAELLTMVLGSSPCVVHKALHLRNMTVPLTFFKKNWERFNRPDMEVITAGVRRVGVPETDDFKTKLVKRFHFLHTKGKRKTDVVVKTLSECLPEGKLRSVKQDLFQNTLLLFKAIDADLIQEIVNEYSYGRKRVNAKEFIDKYNELYPPKPKKLKKTKKKAKKKKKNK